MNLVTEKEHATVFRLYVALRLADTELSKHYAKLN